MSSNNPRRRAALVMGHLSLVMALFAASCTATTAPGAKLETITITIKGKAFTMEVADTEAKTAQGLMKRPSLPVDSGMFFVFETAGYHSFWMKDTLIPLDIIYLDEKAKVIEIHTRKALDETGMAPSSPALFVIELNAGRAEAIGLKPGDIVALPDKYLKAAAPTTDKSK